MLRCELGVAFGHTPSCVIRIHHFYAIIAVSSIGSKEGTFDERITPHPHR
jgi:hypothetical protein